MTKVQFCEDHQVYLDTDEAVQDHKLYVHGGETLKLKSKERDSD